MKMCHACKRELAIEKKVGRRDECPSCGVDLHCCFNCMLYERSYAKQCKEPIAELVREKAKANFCDYFVFVESRFSSAPNAPAEQTHKTLDELFKK